MVRLALGSVALAALLVGCGSAPKDRAPDPIATYKHSHAPAPATPPFEEFGRLDGDVLTLTLNPTLIAEQSHQVCDQRPVIAPSTWKQPRCVRRYMFNCAQYEDIPGQEPARCLIGDPHGPCLSSATPKPPPPRYNYVQDCYPAAAGPDTLGKINVYAVPENTRRTEIVRQGQLIGAVSLAPGQTQSIQLPRVDPNSCLALADADGQGIGLRGNDIGPGSHLFATTSLVAARRNAALDQNLVEKRKELDRAEAEFTQVSQAVASNPAWNGKRCVVPPMGPLPPKPSFMSGAAVATNSKAFCLLLLNDQFQEDVVAKGARAKQKYDFLAAAKAMSFDVTKTASCAQGYQYSTDDLAYLRGEHLQRHLEGATDLGGFLLGILGGAKEAIVLTQEQRYQLIANMLDRCASASATACYAPEREWERAADAVRRAPKEAHASCTADLTRALAARDGVKAAEQQLLDAQIAVKSERVQASAAALPLSSALCQRFQ